MIGISADFDPVHLGHVQLIKKGREIGEKEDKQLVVYLNKGYSANHSPFFANYESREKMALKAGAHKVVPVEGLHHRLILSYSVPIRLSKMHEDGVTDYITGANISLDDLKNKASKFIKKEKFLGMPKYFSNRNEIRWYALNEFLNKKYTNKIQYHLVPEVHKKVKISGRLIRQSILDNNGIIPEETKELLPETTIKILETEIKKGNIPGSRNLNEIFKKMNTYSRSKLEKIAYLNGNIINEIIKRRVYRDSESIWAVFRRSSYGPVMTRLAISAIEEEVTKEEVMNLIKYYESKDIIPKEQTIKRVIDRAWYVSSEVQKGKKAQEANEKFKSKKITINNTPLTLYAGLNLTKYESKIIKDDLKCDLYIDKDNKISVEMKSDNKKIKTNLRLPGNEVSYLRYIMDSHFIPTFGNIVKDKKGYKVKINIGTL